ncbi:GlxA family transcriptional regulator [Pararhodobacter oceanensis]|uniref:AraC family transcriptional regulator n=1 Tax=Pararhodobacter oceanensis TaxID=2172121 RepID=A0A2T8HPI0_9RHOB|nr:helix-turn-helix domain-containing protein [Pararhodobacter oceanensis]PVH27330.1 AraC family transcriptional regulator [Pararhodobacter oceanensis]
MKKVSLVLFPGFQMLAYVLATETMRIANKCAAQQMFSWQTLTVTQSGVAASNGATVLPDKQRWPNNEDSDLVLLCAGYDPLNCLPSAFRAWLSRLEKGDTVLGGLDTGTVVLAALGLLDGHEAVLHHEAEPSFREYWPNIEVRDQIYCLTRKRLTAAGGIATGDAMLAWIESVAGSELAAATSDAMAHGEIRSAGTQQRVTVTSDPVLRKMHAKMVENFSEPRSLTQLAVELGLSLKALRKRSQHGLGLNPQEYYMKLRLSQAMQLLRSSEMSATEVAFATGFSSLPAFSRQFKAVFARNPSEISAAKRKPNSL